MLNIAQHKYGPRADNISNNKLLNHKVTTVIPFNAWLIRPGLLLKLESATLRISNPEPEFGPDTPLPVVSV